MERADISRDILTDLVVAIERYDDVPEDISNRRLISLDPPGMSKILTISRPV